MSMKSASEDGGECWRRWYCTHRANLLQLSGTPPKNLCADQLRLTTCCRYAEWLLKNPRVLRFLTKYHPAELRKLEDVLAEFQRACRTPD
jgi:hypothetical protein